MTKLVVRLAKDLVSIKSDRPENSEEKVAQFIFDYLKDLGLKPEKQFLDEENNRFNVIALAGKEPNLMIDGHIDTVPINDPAKWKYNPFGEIAGDKLYGRGSSDTKGNVACMLAAMNEHINENAVYVFNSEEELSLSGIRKILELRETKLKSVKYSLTLEPTDGKIVIGNKGRYTFEITAQGKTAHGSVPEQGENAIYLITKAVSKIEEYNKKLNERKHPLFGQATINVGTIRGGEAHNVVPDLAKITADRRILPGENPEKVEKEFRELIAPLKAEFINKDNACETSKDSKIVKEMQNTLRESGMDDKTYGYSATTELSEISKSGIEGIIFGTGELDQAHKPDECITVKELETGTKIFAAFLKKWK